MWWQTNDLNLQRFLKAARNLVLVCVCKKLDRHNCLKVNTMFDREFTNKDTRNESKTIITKNCQLLTSSNLHEWYDLKVLEYILAELDDFSRGARVDGCRQGYRV